MGGGYSAYRGAERLILGFGEETWGTRLESIFTKITNAEWIIYVFSTTYSVQILKHVENAGRNSLVFISNQYSHSSKIEHTQCRFL